MWPKAAWQFWRDLSPLSIIRKIFEGAMLIRTLPTSLLQIFCEAILNFQVIVKSVKDPCDNFKSNSHAKMFQHT